MHEAYKATQLLQHNVQIESIAACGKHLFICRISWIFFPYEILYKFCSFIIWCIITAVIVILDSTLLLGTRQGHLLMYNVIVQPDGKVNLEQMVYNKTYSKKPVQQIEFILDYNLVVVLADNVVQVHENTSNFNLITQIAKTRGATIFTLDIKVSFILLVRR